MTEEVEDTPPPPRKQRPRMTLGEQTAFLAEILTRCELHPPGRDAVYAGVAVLMLTEEDMLRLETVQQTLAVFELHRADQMVRDKIAKGFRGRK